MPNLVEVGHLNADRFVRIAEIYRTETMVPPDAELGHIVYSDYLNIDSEIPQWVVWLVSGSILLLLVAFGLVLVVRQLRALVEKRADELKQAHNKLQRYIDILDRYIITSSTDLNGRFTYASEAFSQISKYSTQELLTQPHNIIRHPDMSDKVYSEMWRAIEQGNSWCGEILNRAKDGSGYWVEANVEADLNEHGEIIGYTAIQQNITDKKQIEELSSTDYLTGLYNRKK
ncbi:PAS domain-containing protein [Candidatus Reidiella endopervernicosa]|uniref:PAS domain S-box protein n=1 Tax=Candidatus Reidiella endopervernicosa TaxID=2738883 RepID=A0A6N0HWP2_9GAMM|nr:PAS domain S-box protein [Candidatus Reidiella endopervernicosa]QKQ26798.1 PAS domain S-box protein [Candidatus Reidiella endopervernicosa]